MANDPGAGEGGSPTTPSIIYSSTATGGGGGTVVGGTTSRLSSVTARQTSRTTVKAVQDTSGTVLSGADAAGFGLNRPYHDWNVYPTAEELAPSVSTTSATFEALFTCSAEPQHPNIRVRVKVVNGIGTSSEIRLRDRVSGTVVAGPLVVGDSVTIETSIEGALIAPTLSGAGAAMKVDVEARRTAGANTVSVYVTYALGKGG